MNQQNISKGTFSNAVPNFPMINFLRGGSPLCTIEQCNAFSVELVPLDRLCNPVEYVLPPISTTLYIYWCHNLSIYSTCAVADYQVELICPSIGRISLKKVNPRIIGGFYWVGGCWGGRHVVFAAKSPSWVWWKGPDVVKGTDSAWASIIACTLKADVDSGTELTLFEPATLRQS